MKKISVNLVLGFVSVLSFFISAQAQNHMVNNAANIEETPQIVFGQTIEQEISGGQRHKFLINLTAIISKTTKQ